MKKIKNIGVLTSGGDSPGMNAAVRAVVRTAIYSNLKVFAIKNGYDGIIDDNMIEFDILNVSNILQKGGTILGSARSKGFRTKEGRQQAFDNLKKHDIDALIVIGGDGTFRGATDFSQEHDIPCVGMPATIDNDIYGTDHTIGYDTALNTVIEAVDKIKDTASSHGRLFFVEVMGRDSGELALTSGLACGAEAVLVPEQKDDISKLVKKLVKHHERHRSGIILVAEGYKEGGTYQIADLVRKKLPDFDVRVSILGHMQRGGSPSAHDRLLASRLGSGAVEALLDDQKSIMIGVVNNEVVHVPFKKVTKKNKPLDISLLKLNDILNVYKD